MKIIKNVFNFVTRPVVSLIDAVIVFLLIISLGGWGLLLVIPWIVLAPCLEETLGWRVTNVNEGGTDG